MALSRPRILARISDLVLLSASAMRGYVCPIGLRVAVDGFNPDRAVVWCWRWANPPRPAGASVAPIVSESRLRSRDQWANSRHARLPDIPGAQIHRPNRGDTRTFRRGPVSSRRGSAHRADALEPGWSGLRAHRPQPTRWPSLTRWTLAPSPCRSPPAKA